MVKKPASERRRTFRMSPPKKPLKILLASPRGFCAGVERAIQIVERALERYGAPVYVRHEIVHNRYVVESLEAKGAIFVEELDEVPDDRPVVFSAHGVPKAVPAEAGRRKLLYRRRHLPAGLQGPSRGRAPPRRGPHRGPDRPCRPSRGDRHHGPAAAGRGAAGRGRGARPRRSPCPIRHNLAYSTQTTLSVDDTAGIVDGAAPPLPGDRRAAQARTSATPPPTARPRSRRSRRSATLLLVIGAPNSSNSHAAGRGRAPATAAASRGWCSAPPTSTGPGSTASGRSASPPAPRRPSCWSSELIAACRERYDVTVEEVRDRPRRPSSSSCRRRARVAS